LIGKPHLFEFVRREAHLVHALAKTLETRLWFETLVRVLLAVVADTAAVVAVDTVVVDTVVPIAAAAPHPRDNRFVILLSLLLLLGLSIFSALVVETNELFFVVRQFHGFLGFEAVHEFANAFLAVPLVFLALFRRKTAAAAHIVHVRVHVHAAVHAAHAAVHAAHAVVHVTVAVAVVADDSQCPDHALPQKALLVRCLFLFGFFLDPFRVINNGRFGQLPQTALAATAQAAGAWSTCCSLLYLFLYLYLLLLFSSPFRTILFHPHLHGSSFRAAMDVDAIDNVAILAVAILAVAILAVAAFAVLVVVIVPKDHVVVIRRLKDGKGGRCRCRCRCRCR
jgi:hypothetical protein